MHLEVVTWDNVHKVNNNFYKPFTIVWHRMGGYLVIITIIIEKISLEAWSPGGFALIAFMVGLCPYKRRRSLCLSSVLAVTPLSLL